MLLSLNIRFFGFLFDQILHVQISIWPQEGIVGISIEYIPPCLTKHWVFRMAAFIHSFFMQWSFSSDSGYHPPHSNVRDDVLLDRSQGVHPLRNSCVASGC